MATYTFEIPDEVTAWILAEKNINAKTYIQNQFVDSIIKEYEKSLEKTKKQEAEAATVAEIAEIKKKISVTDEKIVK
mgnify:CR=1 FL=1